PFSTRSISMFRRLFPLAIAGKRRGFVFRLATGCALSALVLLLTVITITLSYVDYYAVDRKVTPVELYHNAWKVAKDNIYDQSKLKDWDKWEHKYDDSIKTDDDALRYAREMIASLNESYTGILTVDVVDKDRENADGHYVGIGVHIDTVGGHALIKQVMPGG